MNCNIDNCDKPAKSRQMCSMHAARFYRHGTTDSRRTRRITGGLVELTKGKFAKIDAEDAEKLSGLCWHATSTGYAAGKNFEGVTLYMHRLVTAAPDDKFVDHINGDKLDNRKSNLRFCGPSENLANRGSQKNGGTSSFKGVAFDKARGKWTAQVCFKGKRICGRFGTEIEAARFYNEKAKELHGEFATLNVL